MFFDFEGEGYTKIELLNLPNSALKSKKRGEYSSACPVCGGEDRFQFWPEVGNYWCRQCGLRGFVTDAPIRKNKSLASIISDKITSNTPGIEVWKKYNDNLYNEFSAQEYWMNELGPDYVKAIKYFGLGYCPDYKSLGPTMTIPIRYGEKVYVIKHRLLRPAKAKYITEPRGVGAMIFNLDEIFAAKKVAVTEGEKKAMRLWLEGYTAVSSTTGAEGWRPEWDLFLHGKEVFIIFDPDKAGKKNAKKMQERIPSATIVELPQKVDDWINSGGDVKDVLG
jgi:5S rRNA maturation endonuclease (ribonuclease M5)/Zn ribbon nucleic-acid-binding protein